MPLIKDQTHLQCNILNMKNYERFSQVIKLKILIFLFAQLYLISVKKKLSDKNYLFCLNGL